MVSTLPFCLSFSFSFFVNCQAATLTFFVNSPSDRTFPGTIAVSPSRIALLILLRLTSLLCLLALERSFATRFQSGLFSFADTSLSLAIRFSNTRFVVFLSIFYLLCGEQDSNLRRH